MIVFYVFAGFVLVGTPLLALGLFLEVRRREQAPNVRAFEHECWPHCTGHSHYARLGEPLDVQP